MRACQCLLDVAVRSLQAITLAHSASIIHPTSVLSWPHRRARYQVPIYSSCRVHRALHFSPLHLLISAAPARPRIFGNRHCHDDSVPRSMVKKSTLATRSTPQFSSPESSPAERASTQLPNGIPVTRTAFPSAIYFFQDFYQSSRRTSTTSTWRSDPCCHELDIGLVWGIVRSCSNAGLLEHKSERPLQG
jgi:hypothetical protein